MDWNSGPRPRLRWLTDLWKGFGSWGLFLLLPSAIIFWCATQEKSRSRQAEPVQAADEESTADSLPIRAMSLSADGQYLDVIQSDALWSRHDAHSGQELGQRSLPIANFTKIRIRSDGGVAVSIDHQDRLDLSANSTVLWQGPLPEQSSGESVQNCSLCQNRDLAAAISNEGALWVLAFDESRIISCERYVFGVGLSSVAVSPSGDRIALVTVGRELWIWDTLLKQVALRSTADQAACLFASWSGDGRRLITYGYDRMLQVWHADSLELVQRWRLDSQLAQHAVLSFDGGLAAVADHELLSVREVDSGMIHAELTGHREQITALQFTDQGRTLFSADTQGRIHRWSVPDQRSIWSTP
ncbi:MAG: WD40 repeat domain-containing protein [Planctomycetaceae bacterium]